jgi:hypothetical protein
MIHEFAHFLRPTRLRTGVLALLAALIGTACQDTDPLATSAPSDPPAVASDSLTTTADSLAPAFATTSYSGIPFGPFGLWKSYTEVYWGPSPFTGAQNYVDAGGIVTLINSARSKRQRILLVMTGGLSTRYTTNGRFDLTKWKNKMNTFKTSTIKNAVAAGVADGTIIGNSLIDEPETKRWGWSGGTNNTSYITKATLDGMATYAKGIFPTLPMGVSHTTLYASWRTTQQYHVVDFVWSPPLSWNTVQAGSSVAAWRDKVLSRSRVDGVTVAWGLNPLDGGIRDGDNDGRWECPSTKTQGKGTYYPLCRMTASMVREWAKTLIAATPGCAFVIWKYDGGYMSRTDNQQAFRDVASILGSKAKKSCRRP